MDGGIQILIRPVAVWIPERYVASVYDEGEDITLASNSAIQNLFSIYEVLKAQEDYKFDQRL